MADQEQPLRDENGQPYPRAPRSVSSSAPGLKLADDAAEIKKAMDRLGLKGDSGIGPGIAAAQIRLDSATAASLLWRNATQRNDFHMRLTASRIGRVLRGLDACLEIAGCFLYAPSPHGSDFWFKRVGELERTGEPLPPDLREILIDYLHDHLQWCIGN